MADEREERGRIGAKQVLTGVLVVALVAATVVGVQAARGREWIVAAGTGPVVADLVTPTTLPQVPAYANGGQVKADDGRMVNVPTQQATFEVCAGKPMPSWLNVQGRSGTRTVAYARTDGATGSIVGGGLVPGPVPVASTLDALSKAGPLGWVACVGEPTVTGSKGCEYQEQDMFGRTTSGPVFTVTVKAPKVQSVELREVTTGKVIGRTELRSNTYRGQAIPGDGCPETVRYGSDYTVEADDPGYEGIDALVHDVLG